jgi:hypothetical protein
MNYIITLANNRTIVVRQLKEYPYFLHLSLSMTYDDSDNRSFSALPGGIHQLVREIRMQLSLAKTAFSGVEAPFKEITLSKTVPITQSFG